MPARRMNFFEVARAGILLGVLQLFQSFFLRARRCSETASASERTLNRSGRLELRRRDAARIGI